MEYFIQIVECGSLTKASQKLYLSQPSLTKAISGLEAEYNIQLFQRSAKGIHLTPAGRDFLEYARSVVESCRALEQMFGQKEGVSVPSVMIASQQFDFIHDILVELYCLNEDHALQINLKEDDRGRIVDLVENREADIGILVVTEEDSKVFRSLLQSKNLEMHILDKSSVYVSMGPKSRLYGQSMVDVEEAERYLHVLLDTEASMRRELRYTSVYRGVNRERLIFCNSINTCKKFLKETDALVNTPKWVLGLFADTFVRSVPLRMNGEAYPEVNSLVWIKRKKEKLNSSEKKFIKLLESHFEKRSAE